MASQPLLQPPFSIYFSNSSALTVLFFAPVCPPFYPFVAIVLGVFATMKTRQDNGDFFILSLKCNTENKMESLESHDGLV